MKCCGMDAELKTFSTFKYYYCGECKKEVTEGKPKVTPAYGVTPEHWLGYDWVKLYTGINKIEFGFEQNWTPRLSLTRDDWDACGEPGEAFLTLGRNFEHVGGGPGYALWIKKPKPPQTSGRVTLAGGSSGYIYRFTGSNTASSGVSTSWILAQFPTTNQYVNVRLTET